MAEVGLERGRRDLDVVQRVRGGTDFDRIAQGGSGSVSFERFHHRLRLWSKARDESALSRAVRGREARARTIVLHRDRDHSSGFHIASGKHGHDASFSSAISVRSSIVCVTPTAIRQHTLEGERATARRSKDSRAGRRCHRAFGPADSRAREMRCDEPRRARCIQRHAGARQTKRERDLPRRAGNLLRPLRCELARRGSFHGLPEERDVDSDIGASALVQRGRRRFQQYEKLRIQLLGRVEGNAEALAVDPKTVDKKRAIGS